MKKAILLAIVVIIIAFLFFNSQARAYEPQLHIATSITEAETYESVLIMITSDPLEYQDNLTISSNHTIDLEFYNLGTGKTIYEGNLTLKYGTATWSFMVVPEWGEFTGIIKITDPLINSEASIPIEISYSQDYQFKKWTDYQKLREDARDRENRENNDRNNLIVGGSVITIWSVIPLLFLKFQHNFAKKHNEDSLYDRFMDRYVPYSETTSRFGMYHTDPNYRHPRTGLPMMKANHLLEELEELKSDETYNLYQRELIETEIRKRDPDLIKSIQRTPEMTVEELRATLEDET